MVSLFGLPERNAKKLAATGEWSSQIIAVLTAFNTAAVNILVCKFNFDFILRLLVDCFFSFLCSFLGGPLDLAKEISFHSRKCDFGHFKVEVSAACFALETFLSKPAVYNYKFKQSSSDAAFFMSLLSLSVIVII